MLKKSLLFGVLFLPLAVSAATLHISDDYFLRGSEKATDDLYVLARRATIAGEVRGDAVALGQAISSHGEIGADVLFAGGAVDLRGRVADDARLLGGQIVVSGEVSHDLLAIGPEIEIVSSASVGGDLYAVGERMRMAGKVDGRVRFLGDELRIDGPVAGDVEAWGEVSFGERGKVGGDLIYHAPRELAIPKERVAKEVIFDEMPRGGMNALAGLGGFFSGFFSLWALMTLTFGCALLFLARSRTEEVLLDAAGAFWLRVLRGLLIILLVPIAAFFLFVTVVGASLGIALAALLTAAAVASSALAGILLGMAGERVFFKRSAFPLTYRPVLLGGIALAAVSMIPYIGPLIYFLLFFAALGSTGTVFYRHLREVW